MHRVDFGDGAYTVALFRTFLPHYWHTGVLDHAPRLHCTPVLPMKRSVALYRRLSGVFRSFWVVRGYCSPSETISRNMSRIIKFTHDTMPSPIFIANKAQQHLKKGIFPPKCVMKIVRGLCFPRVFFRVPGTRFLGTKSENGDQKIVGLAFFEAQ